MTLPATAPQPITSPELVEQLYAMSAGQQNAMRYGHDAYINRRRCFFLKWPTTKAEADLIRLHEFLDPVNPDAAARVVQQLVARAQAEGTLRPDVAFEDTGLLLIRLSRPLPGPFPRDLDDALAHRHLDILIDGLRASADRPAGSLSGPAITLEDLRTRFAPENTTP